MVIHVTPLFNWDLPKVELPTGNDTPVLTAEQWVVWFRTMPTLTQIATAAVILDLQRSENTCDLMDVDGRLGRAEDTVESLRAALRGIKDGLRSILEETAEMRPQKKRAARLSERLTAIGVSIKGMGL